MTMNKPHPFASQSWLTIPFEKRIKNPNDELVDILVSLPGCLALGEEFLNQSRLELTYAKSKLLDYVLELISRLDNWHERSYGKVVNPNSQRYFGIPHSAVFTAIYDAANLIAFQLLVLVSPSTGQQIERIHFHARSILTADAFIETNGTIAPAGGYILMVFPLKVLSVWAPLAEQREYAVKKLQNWDREAEANSICRFAAPVLLGSSTEAAPSSVYYANVAARVHSCCPL
jgi:hypothetical protein